MAHTRRRGSAHDPGVVLTHLAVSLADGGDCLADVAVLRNQPDLFAQSIGAHRIEHPEHRQIRRDMTATSPQRGPRRAPVAWAAGAHPTEIVIDIDGALLDAHSDKQHATPTYKRGFGFGRWVQVDDWNP